MAEGTGTKINELVALADGDIELELTMPVSTDTDTYLITLEQLRDFLYDDRSRGNFYSNVSQVCSTGGSLKSISLELDSLKVGFTHDTVTTPEQIGNTEHRIYEVTFDALVENTDDEEHDFQMWLVVCGTIIPNSCINITIGAGERKAISKILQLELTVGGIFIGLQMASDGGSDVGITAFAESTNPTRPSAPSASLSIKGISKKLS